MEYPTKVSAPHRAARQSNECCESRSWTPLVLRPEDVREREAVMRKLSQAGAGIHGWTSARPGDHWRVASSEQHEPRKCCIQPLIDLGQLGHAASRRTGSCTDPRHRTCRTGIKGLRNPLSFGDSWGRR